MFVNELLTEPFYLTPKLFSDLEPCVPYNGGEASPIGVGRLRDLRYYL